MFVQYPSIKTHPPIRIIGQKRKKPPGDRYTYLKEDVL